MDDFLSSTHLDTLIPGMYIIAGVLFIAALAGLSKHETARRGNTFGMVGMGIALLATLLKAAEQTTQEGYRGLGITMGLIAAAMLVGLVIGS